MFIPATTHDKYCWAWSRVYIKSNGRIPCWCHSGEQHTIIHKDFETTDFITDIVNSPEMRKMRLSIIRDNQQYIKQCSNCCCYQEQLKPTDKRYIDSDIDDTITHKATQALQELKKVTKFRSWPIGSIDKINEIQFEPSFPCNLKCPGCLQGWHPNPLKTESPPYLFPFGWFQKTIDSIQSHAVRLERIVFVGRGEPTLNRQLPQMIEYAKTNIPNLVISMDTNSTQPFKPEYLDMTWINCSVDGSTKESYDTYRHGGNFDATINFMQTAAANKRLLSKKCKIRWKYIMFNTNSSESLLNKAQEMAKNIGVDELNFIITTCGAADGSVAPFKTTIAEMENYIDNNKIFANTTVSRS